MALVLGGGIEFAVGPLQFSSHSPRGALFLAIGAGLASWAAFIAAERRDGEHWRPHAGILYTLGLTVLAIGLNAATLAQPAPPPDEHNCVFDNPIGHGFRHLLNCDSPEFLALAQEPSLVFENPVRQSRPLSFAVPFLMAQPLALVPRLASTWPYTPYAAEFAAYLVVNLAVLVAGLQLFTVTLESGTGVRGGPELMLALVVLGANNVTKLFLWTPHVQLFNLFVPCLTMYVCFRLAARERPLDAREGSLLGLALGVGLLWYGSFAIAIACVAAIQVAVYRRVTPAVILLAVAAVPYACWVAGVVRATGSFYNHEIETYRQFVWVVDCVESGTSACLRTAGGHLATFAATAAPVVALPLAVIAIARAARRVGSQHRPAAGPHVRALRRAVFCNLLVATAFLAAMGFSAPRLIWLLMPGLILLGTVELQQVRFSRPARAGAWEAITLGVALVYLVVLVSAQGPYN